MSKKIIEVKVGRKHIAEGEIGKSTACPIAKALIGMGAENVGVGLITASFVLDGKHYAVNLSKPARKFVESFDGRKRAKPSTFRLRVAP